MVAFVVPRMRTTSFRTEAGTISCFLFNVNGTSVLYSARRKPSVAAIVTVLPSIWSKTPVSIGRLSSTEAAKATLGSSLERACLEWYPAGHVKLGNGRELRGFYPFDHTLV